jgi:trk system potassium uptake protein TrkH
MSSRYSISVRGHFAPYIVGVSLISLSLFSILFMGLALLTREPFLGFAITGLCGATIGGLLVWLGEARPDPSRHDGLTGVLLIWLALPLFGAIPYAVSGGMTPLNALFESMSGFTATGATVVTDFTSVPSSLFLWRSLSQWLGGIGIIVIFIAVFPQLAIAGRQLFFAESPGPTEERLAPRLRTTAKAVLIIYVGLTVLCASAYAVGGMRPLEAINHAFTTVAAGGFSPNGSSFQQANPALTWIAIVFMVFAGTNFALLYRALIGRPKDLWRDIEFRAYLIIILVAGTALTAILIGTYAPPEALRHGLFQTISILTTTGYASANFANWPLPGQMVLMILMFIGGSAGSAAGGVKIVRWLIIARHSVREVQLSLHPRAVLPVRLGGRIIPEEVMRSVAAFTTLFVALFASSTIVLVFFGADLVTAISAAIATVGNVGPGLGLVGPLAHYADLHPVSRALLIFNMYAGRLEIVTVFVIFTGRWWFAPLFRK